MAVTLGRVTLPVGVVVLVEARVPCACRMVVSAVAGRPPYLPTIIMGTLPNVLKVRARILFKL